MSRGRRRKAAQTRKTSTLKQHKQKGKTLSPPLLTMPAPMLQVPWLRDTFPDMIWLAMLIMEYGTRGMHLATKVLDRIDDVIAQHSSATQRPERLVISGQLSAFDLVPEVFRPAILEALQEDDLFERAVPWTFARALTKYPDVPGMWLFNGWKGNEQVVPADAPEKLLARIIADSSHGQSPFATRAKFMIMRAWLKSDRLTVAPHIAEEWGPILSRYPDRVSEEERQRIEPSIRAMFLSLFGPDIDGSDDQERVSLAWAKAFWRTNWQLYKCVAAAPGIGDDADETPTPATGEAVRQIQEHWRVEIDELTSRFLDVARSADPDLYSPDKHEVLTGITYRVLRGLNVLIGNPSLWTIEHGATYIRGLIESRIVVKWLSMKDDADLYARFKAYGRGRLKLYKLHLEDYREGLEDPPSDLDAQIGYMETLVNQDVWEEFQEISIEGNFAGVDTRRMAEHVNMLTEYRLIFAPASATVHGEWTALDQYALALCRNPLHRWHRIPRDDMRVLLGPELVQSALDHASKLVDDYSANWQSIQIERCKVGRSGRSEA